MNESHGTPVRPGSRIQHRSGLFVCPFHVLSENRYAHGIVCACNGHRIFSVERKRGDLGIPTQALSLECPHGLESQAKTQ